MKPISNNYIRQHYKSGADNLIRDFYLPCLDCANRYDRAVGYFRSSVFSVIGPQIADFAKRQGKMRLVCSVEIDANDYDSIEKGLRTKEAVSQEIIEKLVSEMIDEKRYIDKAKLLATLIAINCLRIKFAFRAMANGIYHEKLGIFSDEFGNSLSFIGSANETFSGWSSAGNYESIEVFTNWNSIEDSGRVDRHQQHFDLLWNNNERGLTVVDFPIAAKNSLLKIACRDLQEYENQKSTKLGYMQKQVKLPMPHQLSAIENWRRVGCHGILEHATGSGKTITAIIAIREHVELGFPALILVPSELLLSQWKNEIASEIPNSTVLVCGAGNSSWKVKGNLRAMVFGCIKEQKRIIISTMQTSATEMFHSKFSGVSELLLVADEVHQIGSEFLSNSLKINATKRLGLSATPARYGDDEGTARILKYFGPIVEPKFSLQDAIRTNRLVQYQYFPQITQLTVQEEEEWNNISDKLRLEYFKLNAKESKNVEGKQRIKNLLIRRSRIAKKASKKIPSSVRILQKNFVDGDSWLVYCEDLSQLEELAEELKKEKILAVAYHSNMTDSEKENILLWYKRFGGIMLSMRCLDEGVDIPQINKALIIASSQNPRQFIQRRGRVLRHSINKGIADIYDMLVVPASLENQPKQFSLLKSELLRAIEFADHAVNKSCALDLQILSDRMGALEGSTETEDDNG